jgi:hypothetical protein
LQHIATLACIRPDHESAHGAIEPELRNAWGKRQQPEKLITSTADVT